MPVSPADSPTLARPLSLPIRLIPASIHSVVISRLLNTLLAQALREGELDFLDGRALIIHVEDAGASFNLSLRRGVLIAADSGKYDLKVSGSVYDFMLLVSRREDADTLFFQRRLKMEGDTELGLYLKNFLDGMDVESLPFYKISNPLLLGGLGLYEQISSVRQRLRMLNGPVI